MIRIPVSFIVYLRHIVFHITKGQEGESNFHHLIPFPVPANSPMGINVNVEKSQR